MQMEQERTQLRGSLMRLGIPRHMHQSIEGYVFDGQPPGDFLGCVLRNDLAGAAGQADEENQTSLFAYACVLHNVMPSIAWRSQENIDNWVGWGGLVGLAHMEKGKGVPDPYRLYG